MKGLNDKVGERVLITGWGLGTDHWGGYAGEAAVRADWTTPLPAGLGSWQAAALGTAGYTAMLCIEAVERGGVAGQLEVNLQFINYARHRKLFYAF